MHRVEGFMYKVFLFSLGNPVFFDTNSGRLCLLMSGVMGPGSVPASCMLTSGKRLNSEREKQNNK